MSLSITCSCGSSFDVEETFAGQTVNCPECQGPVRVPAVAWSSRAFRGPAKLRTSGYALTSVLLGVILAFTLVGTVIAVILGCISLVSIARNRERVTGAGYAVFGIVWSLVFTGLTLLALTRGELFGVDQLRQQIMGGEVDLSGPLEVVVEKDGFAITRPSRRWGVAKESMVQHWHPNANLFLVNLVKDSYVTVTAQVAGPMGMEQWRESVVKNFNESPRTGRRFQKGAWEEGQGGNNDPAHRFQIREVHALAPVDGAEAEEMVLDGRQMGHTYTYVVRIIKDDRNRKVYFIYAWTPARRFPEMNPDLHKAMDSFRILKQK
jgi:hypothetical protein